MDKKNFYFLFLCFNFLLTYRVMLVSMFYVEQLVTELIYLIVLGGYIAIRTVRRIQRKDYRFNHLELLMLAFFCLPLLSAFSAWKQWGQPLHFGIATMRDFYLLFGSLITYNLLREGKVDMKMVEKAMVTVAWISIIFFYGMSLLTDPLQFKETGFAAAHEGKGGDAYYQFQTGFMFFGAMYYTVKTFIQKNYKLLIPAAVFIVYIVFFRLDRTTMAVVGAAILLFLATAIPLRTQVVNAIRFGIPGLLLILTIFLIKPDIADNYIMMFGEMTEVVGQVNSGDAEKDLRVREFESARPYIIENPILGNGKVSRRWVPGGYSYFLGTFFISDLGIIGQIFVYGLFGAAILYSQFLFSFFFSSKIGRARSPAFLMAIKYCLFAIALDSLTNGYLSIFSAQAFTLSVLIYRFYELDRVKALKKVNLNPSAQTLAT